MTKSLATVAAALMLAAPAASAFAQGIGAGAFGPRVEAPIVQTRSLFGVPSWVFEEDATVDADAPATTGSLAPRRAARDVDASVKRGSAARQDRHVPQDGAASGGLAE